MRLDKYLAQSGEHTRSQATRMLRAGMVQVNGEIVGDGSRQIQPNDRVLLQGQEVTDRQYQYVMLHKPEGVLTAARDRAADTVMDLLPESLRRRRVLPVGRLDKDATGLLLLTNDGELAHRLLSPKRHVWKRYLVTVSGRLLPADQEAFRQGMALKDFVAKPAELIILSAEEKESKAIVELREGKFHQVKRMLLARGHEVQTLHRMAFGSLSLPKDLPVGAFRALTALELQALRKCAGLEGDQRESEEDHG